ncbi:conjugal transfer protein [Niastella koreensis]|uniref:TrwC relaxase n=2 Tax=Niastella koreensis TaxID=354356 RepID=G8T8Z1_NIAKG|nr:MobF family relaxase [Niastella koreensis]AEW02348.1 TrwC relaxase [Niastella koreensis GR20-10]OQP46432.1 conjugal transfer protein [Niastella koreensis]
MIRMIQVKSAAHAEDYFNDAFLQGDYYINDQEYPGAFHGKVANRLGIAGPTTKEAFHSLCWNINPATGETLTQRTSDSRTVYYDINYHCPKSVSTAYAVYGDERIPAVFQESVHETMQDIEADGQTRVRKNGQNENRPTGELLWGSFLHLTARPVDDDTNPDPHIHSHCTVLNATWDDTEQVYKAGQFRDIKRDMPYYQERFYKRLADKLTALGYTIRRTATAFELEGIPQPVIDLFSKRNAAIKRIAKENNITDAAELDQLGAQTRAKKRKDISLAELKQDWLRQVAELNLDDGKNSGDPVTLVVSVTPQQCIDHALSQCFERASVAHDRRILAAAYRYGLENSCLSLDDITQAFHQDSRIVTIQDGQKIMCTTHEVLAEEKRMVDLAIAGKGQLTPLYRMVPPLDVAGDQATAVTHVLTTLDRVSNVQGGAGTGKTTTLKELVKHINGTGIKSVLVAPTASASRGVMREEGFKEADTVARLLVDTEMQNALQDGCLIVDEAGLLGIKDMTALLRLVTEKNARLILFGDTRQHPSVVRGDALRILNTVAGIKAAEINKIYRQRHDGYRKAVEDIAVGNITSAFERLEEFNAITEIEADQLNGQLVNEYMQAINQGKTALVVSPTHQQGEAVTAELRNALRANGTIGQHDIPVTRYINLNYTDAEKADGRMYQPGFAVQFNQNMPGITRGTVCQVSNVSGDTFTVVDPAGNALPLPLDKAHQFTVYRKTVIPLAIGDSVTITRGSSDRTGKRLNNGQSLKVVSVDEGSDIILINPTTKVEYRVSPEFGHLNHGYTTTSHGAQGRTTDEVYIAMPASTFPASNMKQFYVSVSRARDKVHLYTDDKAALMEQVSQIGDRQSALELLGPTELSQFVARQWAYLESPPPQLTLAPESQSPAIERPVRPYAPKPVIQ